MFNLLWKSAHHFQLIKERRSKQTWGPLLRETGKLSSIMCLSLSPGWLTRCYRHESESQAICSSIQFFVYCSKELDQRHCQKQKEGQFKKKKTLQKM